MSSFSWPTATTEWNVFRPQMEEMSPDIGHSSDCIELAVAGLVFGQCGSKASGCKGEHFTRGLIEGSVMTLLKDHV